MSSDELDITMNMNVTSEESRSVDLEEKPSYYLFVECLETSEVCSVTYKTASWEQTVTVPAGESSTFPASNTQAILSASMSPEYYRVEGPVSVVLTFSLSVGSSTAPEHVSLTAADLTVKNGEISSELEEVTPGEFHFQITPSPRSSFAVVLSSSIATSNGVLLQSGVIQACIFDDAPPSLLNTQFVDGLIDEQEEKTILLSLNEPATVSSFSGVVQNVNSRNTPNSFEVVVSGSGNAEVQFDDFAGNSFLFSLPVVFGNSRNGGNYV